ncbi:unnamed protein product [Phyllotreta striolata]|uniref:C2H2-type domain-containing protein n=1 Tax=Phyllotreta striolata TaxID=444603 RepID=A0A9N9TAN6_PHYSR|nr:unnamed protein product [Phyllotreta striolata]
MDNSFLDFEKICRVCLNEGIMMSIFKVNISKKLMSLAPIQVWQNDGLPTQICNKCSAKLHISFQFKKLCEKSDSKLRQYLKKASEQPADRQQSQLVRADVKTQQAPNNPQINLPQYAQPVAENCVYIECNPLIENIPQDNHFMSLPQNNQSQMTQIDYNQLGTFNVEGVGQVQVYNSSYSMPLQQTTVLHNTEVTSVQMQSQHQVQYIDQPQPQVTADAIVKKEDEKTTFKKESKPESARQCSTCNKIFANTTKLTRHMKTHSSDLPYKCKECNKGFAHSGNFKIHLRTHTGERPFRCVVCDKGCRQAQDLEKHMRTHTGERPHKCLMCPKAFSTRSNLIAHVRIHTGERPYVCCVCQKSFCQSNELTKHMRTHTGEKSHICDICNKGFNGSSTLIVHRRSHTGERPYVCPVCNKAFTQNSCLMVHMKRHNDKKTKENKELMVVTQETKENINCNFCNSSFESTSDYSVHVKSHSSGEES